MDTTNHPLIGQRIEHAKAIGGVVAYIGIDADGDFVAILVTDTGDLKRANIWMDGWRIVTPKPTATTAPEPDADGWIPLDGTRFPDVAPGGHITVKFLGGFTRTGPADGFAYERAGVQSDIIAWKRT